MMDKTGGGPRCRATLAPHLEHSGIVISCHTWYLSMAARDESLIGERDWGWGRCWENCEILTSSRTHTATQTSTFSSKFPSPPGLVEVVNFFFFFFCCFYCVWIILLDFFCCCLPLLVRCGMKNSWVFKKRFFSVVVLCFVSTPIALHSFYYKW